VSLLSRTNLVCLVDQGPEGFALDTRQAELWDLESGAF
jgi:hypothetical protein